MSQELLATVLASASGAFSPQHQNNFSLEITGVVGWDGTLSLSLSRASNPKVGVDEVEIPFGNGRVWVAGKSRYEGGTIEFRDYVDRDTQGALVNWFAMVNPQLLDVTNGAIGVPSDYKLQANGIEFAPDGTSLREWLYFGLWPVSGDFGNLDQASSEQVLISVNFRYDAVQYLGPTASSL